MSQTIGADSEVGGLRTVLMHRPGPELGRVTPRTRERLAFSGGPPWVGRAQQEHDALAQVLRDRGTEVLYLAELLQDVLQYAQARGEAIGQVLAGDGLGEELRGQVRDCLEALAPRELAGVLVAGLARDELRTGRGIGYELLGAHDFVIEPLPNLVFSRDSSTWIGDQAVVGNLPGPRRREPGLLSIIYEHHPRFAGARPACRPGGAALHCGDLLQLAPGVVALGFGDRTSPAAVERLAGNLLGEALVHTVLAIPLDQRAGGGLDEVCAVVADGTVVMAPALAFTLAAYPITRREGEIRISRPQPLPGAAAQAIGIDRLRIIETGTEPRPGIFGQWDDGTNALAIGPGVVICAERSVSTIARLAKEGIEVIQVPTAELGGRGGPRCLCTPIARVPAAAMAEPEPEPEPGWPSAAWVDELEPAS